MNDETIKEELSVCYLSAISSINGIALERHHRDDDSIDVEIKKVVIRKDGFRFNSQISIQLKATSSQTQYSIGENEITYKLNVKNYNDLCSLSVMPSMLGLLILPPDKNDWISWNEQELILKGQFFWISLQGRKLSNNSNTINVKIPKTNRLKPDNIESLLNKVAEEGCL